TPQPPAHPTPQHYFTHRRLTVGRSRPRLRGPEMLLRFFLGIIKGTLAGGLVALALVKGFGVVSWSGTLAYLTAMGLGVLTALVSGNAIWRRGAGVENALKAVAGIGIACVGMLAVRKWMP